MKRTRNSIENEYNKEKTNDFHDYSDKLNHHDISSKKYRVSLNDSIHLIINNNKNNNKNKNINIEDNCLVNKKDTNDETCKNSEDNDNLYNIKNYEVYDELSSDSDIDDDEEYNIRPDLKEWEKLIEEPASENIWVSATKTKNYLLRDPVLDWIEKYYFTHGYGDKNIDKKKLENEKISSQNEMTIIQNTLFSKGNRFEKLIYDAIEKKLGKKNCIDVIKDYKECRIEKMQDTIKYMQEGYPIIRQAVLYNNINKTYGIADLLIRSDYINKLFTDSIQHISSEEENIGCKFSLNYHYRVIDIKWSQLQLCSDGFKILNTDRYPSYKGQLAIYNSILGKIQNYIPSVAYILGKSYRYECCNVVYSNYNSFCRLGHILYDDFDLKYIDLTRKAIKWYRDMLHEGHKWNLITSMKPELFPNMCNYSDAPYTSIKYELAVQKNEITRLWRIGIKHRETAFSHDIFSWNHKDCNSTTLGLKPWNKTAVIVDNMLLVNKDNTNTIYDEYKDDMTDYEPSRNKKSKINKINKKSKLNKDNKYYEYLPKKIQSKMYDWRNTTDYVDFFIDFETINDVFYKEDVSINNNKTTNYIFMAGVGYYLNNEWIFKEFHIDKLNAEEEKRIIKEFKNYIYSVFNKYKKNNNSKIRLFHWSHAEVTFLENFNEKNEMLIKQFLNNVVFADLYKLFVDEPISIKGAFTYKLKDVSNALYNLGIIKSSWTTKITNGLTAMIDGCIFYKSVENNNLDNNMITLFNNIIKYNEVDCKVMGEILIWMRTKL
jgi:hypothetical protein